MIMFSSIKMTFTKAHNITIQSGQNNRHFLVYSKTQGSPQKRPPTNNFSKNNISLHQLWIDVRV